MDFITRAGLLDLELQTYRSMSALGVAPGSLGSLVGAGDGLGSMPGWRSLRFRRRLGTKLRAPSAGLGMSTSSPTFSVSTPDIATTVRGWSLTNLRNQLHACDLGRSESGRESGQDGPIVRTAGRP